ncbi:ribosomal protein S18-alanine N-acetyltransferase [Halopseudomonas salegens]|uniref:ribosomal protein S18-alanine N-acetyltransferase n=1 Tax=Halopseudomonas salegens TaxID=1434072 RepID=UPI0038B40976
MREDVQLRVMQESDIDSVLSVEYSAYSHPWTRGIFLDCLKSGYECWILYRGEQQVGHAVLTAAAGESHLLNLTVKPESQGNGFGRYLLQHMLVRAQHRQADVCFLEVRASNAAAIALYDQVGFNEIGRRKNYYPMVGGREDALVMAFTLDEPEG